MNRITPMSTHNEIGALMQHKILTIVLNICSALFAVYLYSTLANTHAVSGDVTTASNITVADRNGKAVIMTTEYISDDRGNHQSIPCIKLHNGYYLQHHLLLGLSHSGEPHITMTSPNGESTAILIIGDNGLALLHTASNKNANGIVFDALKGTLMIKRHDMNPIVYK